MSEHPRGRAARPGLVLYIGLALAGLGSSEPGRAMADPVTGTAFPLAFEENRGQL